MVDVCTTDNVSVTLFDETFALAAVPVSHVRTLAWALTRLLFHGCGLDSAPPLLALIREPTEVLTIVGTETQIASFHIDCGDVDHLTSTSDAEWKAFEIRMGSGAEVPGVVGLISHSLARRGISIMNLSTYDADIVLVQSSRVDEAAACFKSIFENLGKVPVSEYAVRTPTPRKFSSDVAVLPRGISVVQLRSNMLAVSFPALTRMLLFECDIWPVEDGSSSDSKRDADGCSSCTHVPDLFWCLVRIDREVTVFLDSVAHKLFPDGALVHDPVHWKAVRLVSEPIPFEITGIVNRMSAPLAALKVPILNLSTFHSNYSLVEEVNEDRSVAALRASLSSIDDAPSP